MTQRSPEFITTSTLILKIYIYEGKLYKLQLKQNDKKTKQKKPPDIKSPHHLFILKSDSREQLIHSPRTTRDFPLLLLTTTQHFI